MTEVTLAYLIVIRPWSKSDATYSLIPDLPSSLSPAFFSKSPIPTKLAMLRCGGKENRLRISSRRRPNIGASTVNTKAENPAASARSTKFLVT